jgi:hypothetical protein
MGKWWRRGNPGQKGKVMTGVRAMRCGYFWLLGVVLAAALAGVGWAQNVNPNEREVKPQQNVQDADEVIDKGGNFRADSKVWVLHFRFKDPRYLTVDVPGRGRKVCLYLWYQVINWTNEPHTFLPNFELVTLDTHKSFPDEILPRVQEAIRQVEDPTDHLKIKNSVTIGLTPIPPSKKEAAVRAVTGVAIWDNVDPDSNRFRILVSGLSNGWTWTDDPDPAKAGQAEPVLRRKTLQLDFKRVGDRSFQDSREIQFVPPPQWVYQAVRLAKPTTPEKEVKPAPKEVVGRTP